MFKKTVWLIFSLLSLCLSLANCSQSEPTDIFGESISLNQAQQKWLVINYWAPWCKPCLTEIELFNQFSKKYPKKLLIVGVNYDNRSPSEQRDFAHKHTIQYPLLTSDIGVRYHLSSPQVLPTTYLISPNGKTIRTLIGPQTETSLKQALGWH